VSDGVPTVNSVWSSAKTHAQLSLLEAGVTYRAQAVTVTVGALPTCVYTPGTVGTLTAAVNGVLGPVNGVALIDDDRLLVMHELEPRRNGVYTLGDGDAANP
jgi:hypothetical protein